MNIFTKIKKYFSRIQAFTILETIFATMIFSLALVALMSVAGGGIVSTKNASDEMIASYLNQEALEALRWYRDEEKINMMGLSQLQTQMPCGLIPGTSTVCSVLLPPPTSVQTRPVFVNCVPGAPCTEVYFDANTGAYYNDVTPGLVKTKFNRWITLYMVQPGSTPSNIQTVTATSTVTWVSGGIRRTVVLPIEFKEW